MFLLQSTYSVGVQVSALGYVLGKANELCHCIEACRVVDANVPRSVMARGNYGTEKFRSGATAGLSEQCGGDGKLVGALGGAAKLL